MSDTKNKVFKIVKEAIPYIIVIILVLLFKMFFYAPIKVNGESMMKTLHDKDIMILDIIGYKINGIKRFDIVVVDEGDEFIIKRVIGLPGEKVTYKDNILYINDKKIIDKYASKKTDDFEEVVPKNQYFVMGDNRTNSMDSRVFGAFPKSKILGKTKFVILPFKRWGIKE